MKKNKVVFFDFDGVIVNSCQLSLEINRELYSDITFSELQTWGEGNVYSTKLREDFNESQVNFYFERYIQRIIELVPVEGMEEIIKKLSLEGYKLIVVSSSDEEAINSFLKKNNLDKYFIKVMARKTHSSKVEKFKMVFDEFRIKADDALIITDTVGDVKEAHEVKMKAIGVIWGLHEKERLEENGVDFVAEVPKDILKGIDKLLALN